jgi:hypothetical protein
MEILFHMLSAERRPRRLLVRGVIRRARPSRRNTPRRRQQAFIRVLFLFILLTVSITTALVSFHIHPRYAAPLLSIYTLMFFGIMLINPGKRQRIRSV